MKISDIIKQFWVEDSEVIYAKMPVIFTEGATQEQKVLAIIYETNQNDIVCNTNRIMQILPELTKKDIYGIVKKLREKYEIETSGLD